MMQYVALSEHLCILEERLLQPGIRKSAQELDVLLADDFVEFGSSGRIFNKQQIIDSLANESAIRMTLTDFKLTLLAPDVVLTTYRIQRHHDGKHSLRSSVWKCRQNQWQMVFHQGTPTESRGF